jgi:hypothetical protein
VTIELADSFSPAPFEGAQDRLQPGNPLVNEETGYEQERLREMVEGNVNEGQRPAVERILEKINGEPKVFFLRGPGWTGKRSVEELPIGGGTAGRNDCLSGSV